MTTVVLVHVAVAALVGVAGGRLRARVFWLAALAPATTVAWVIARGGDILDGQAYTQRYEWVPGLGVDLSFRVDAFSLLLLGIIGGIGVLVMLYASSYFHHEPGLARFGALLVGFTGAMTGLVAADDLLLVFVFWELTSVTSYGLIGFKDEDPAARASAAQALLVTGAGGLVLLAGFLLLTAATGTGSLSGLDQVEVTGTQASWAAVLILIGCFTKSAQVPFHGWLPGAMAAPTPVSAYLHSATMVKAGVFLVARLSPSLADLPPWRPLTVGVGLATMVWGGYRALRQTDLKLVLAYGTVSQLGMLIATFGTGESKLLFAGTALLLAHAVYKASIFMVVGIIDHSTHTRQIESLSGLARAMPVVMVVAAIGAASMAGVIPFLGFLAKEAAILGFEEAGFWASTAALAVFVAASGVTAAYTLRFLWGGFANRPGVTTECHPPGFRLVLPAAVLAVPTVLLGVAPALADELIRPAAGSLYEPAGVYELVLWPGLTSAFLLSLLALGIGVVLFLVRVPVERAQARVARRFTAADVFSRTVSGTLVGAARVTGVVQSGSLPLYLGVIVLSMMALPLFVLVGDIRLPDGWVWAESPLQVVVIACSALAATGLAVAQRRFAAVLLLGVVGFSSAGLFVIQGAPDLALTQLLVETVVIVVFVLVLRHLPARFRVYRWSGATGLRVIVSGVVGLFMFGATVTTLADRTAEPVDREIAEIAYPQGDGSNIVNVTLVDIRGLDTVGEATVLVVAALGVVALVRAGRDPGDG
jgi:multicomponent Na+:H+ antiporter subunit A